MKSLRNGRRSLAIGAVAQTLVLGALPASSARGEEIERQVTVDPVERIPVAAPPPAPELVPRNLEPRREAPRVLVPESAPVGGDKTGASGQAISVPPGAGTIQGMGESFSTQTSTGVATFSVPFALPRARGGVQPSLVLSYSSGGGHGLAGVGWDVGWAYIARQTDRGLPGYDDRPQWHPQQDRFIFNGAQELVPICVVRSTSCASTLPAGEAMPGWADGWQYFRSRIEGAYQRFFWSPDHRTWRVQSKTGESIELPRRSARRLGLRRRARS